MHYSRLEGSSEYKRQTLRAFQTQLWQQEVLPLKKLKLENGIFNLIIPKLINWLFQLFTQGAPFLAHFGWFSTTSVDILSWGDLTAVSELNNLIFMQNQDGIREENTKKLQSWTSESACDPREQTSITIIRKKKKLLANQRVGPLQLHCKEFK